MVTSLVLLAVAALTVLIIIYLNIIDKKIHQILLILAILNTLMFGVYALLYTFDVIVTEDWFNYLFYSHIGVSGLFTLILSIWTLFRLLFTSQHYNKFMGSIQNAKNNIYFVVDRKERIKQMSEGMLEELGFSFKDVKGKHIFDVFNRSIRVTHFDDIETNNRSLEIFYENYRKESNKDTVDQRTLILQNHNGKSVLIRTTEKPLFLLNRYYGRMNIGEKQSDFNLLEVEEKLNKSQAELESLRLKYIATLEITDQGLYYIDLDDRSIWASEILKEKLNLAGTMINFDDFQKYIYREDLNNYLGTLSNLTPRKDNFKTRYRFMINGQYVWIADKGKRIFEDRQSNLIIGSMEVIDASGYSKTGLEVLDNLKTEQHLVPHLNKLTHNGVSFQLALFHLSNLPEINQEYGREVGNMLISEYVKKLIGSFMSESSDIFRIAGTTFAVTIVDPRKSSILKTGVTKNPNFLDFEMKYGVIHPTIKVKMGVAESPNDETKGERLLAAAEQALNVTKLKNYQSNVCYFGDLDD